MAIEVTLKLPESLVENAKRLGSATHREMETVLVKTWVGQVQPVRTGQFCKPLALAMGFHDLGSPK